MGKDSAYNKWCWENWTCKKGNQNIFSQHTQNLPPKVNIDLNIGDKSTNILEEKKKMTLGQEKYS